MQELPQGFIKMLHSLLGDEADKLIEALNSPPSVGVRLNRLKPGADFPDAEKVPWCESGLYLENRPQFIFDPLFHAGAYYVQDPSSMIYETVIKILIEKFRDNKERYPFVEVLDLCAAPGGKTTAMINSLPEDAYLIANEYVSKRVPALKENLEKWGYENVSITNKDSEFFSESGDTFDIIAVDAPCSGEGMMRKEEVARTQWSLELVEKCSSLQKEILRNAVLALKPGGFLIYSTCTFNRCENEDNAEYIKEKLGLLPVDLEFPKSWSISSGIDCDLPVYRFMPHITKGEGLFLAVFQKTGKWEETTKSIKIAQPTQPDYPHVEVDKTTAISYLHRESIKLSEDAPLGMVYICYKGHVLGPAKNIGSRANNLYPKNRRILKSI